MEDPVFLLTGDVARALKRSVQSVRHYEKSGRLPAQRTPDGTRLYREADVQRLAQELAGKSAPPSGEAKWLEHEPVTAN